MFLVLYYDCYYYTPKTSFCQNASIDYYLHTAAHVIYYYTRRIIRKYYTRYMSMQAKRRLRLNYRQLSAAECDQRQIARLTTTR